MCFVSTSEVYGNTGSDRHKILETDPIRPSNPYGASKAAIDMYIQERFANDGLNGFITRAFSHTGPRRGINFPISSDAYQLALISLGKKEPVLDTGNLETVRVVLDVRDVASAYYKLMVSSTNREVFNICGDVPRKMRYYTEKLVEIAGLTGRITFRNSDKLFRKIDIFYQHGDTEKLKNTISWKPQYSIEETLSDLYDYWIKKMR